MSTHAESPKKSSANTMGTIVSYPQSAAEVTSLNRGIYFESGTFVQSSQQLNSDEFNSLLAALTRKHPSLTPTAIHQRVINALADDDEEENTFCLVLYALKASYEDNVMEFASSSGK
ncbi:hypothetical protein NE237_007107 [Protea cynaroides]|uniref:Uncharacterized protein n=1 Tax=Protea cynaroides TaxID=273540 RepID=A0A9Q0QVX7_9MAGN|nr:hypothetical protein NE237_007107 [Protea cynaroides]